MGNKLEEVAIAQRQALLTSNAFNDEAPANNYTATHTKAKSDEETPAHGKGTGLDFDTSNGGSTHDINGVANATGSGRIANVLKNEFNADNKYTHPDTEGNKGQVTI